MPVIQIAINQTIHNGDEISGILAFPTTLPLTLGPDMELEIRAGDPQTGENWQLVLTAVRFHYE
ncbi:MAG: hypothetical protein BA861_11860 [Desulfobacterales bacterium S3730MH5]|nr:MAG: hypothetical protein BA861_11860 [Desulfobacterales bacterium S3730MH5]